MRRHIEVVRKMEEENRQIARLGCQLSDRFRNDPSPQLLESEQSHRRQTLLWVEGQLRELDTRRIARTPREGPYGDSPDSGRSGMNIGSYFKIGTVC